MLKKENKMLRIYGSEMCSDCIACKKNFDHYHIEYEFLDVCKDLKNLRQFLILRDSKECFVRLKKINDIGLPAIVKEDGEVFTDWEKYLAEQGKEVIYENKNSCSITGKGC